MINENIILTAALEPDRFFFIEVHHTAYRTVIEDMFGWDDELQHNFANSAFESDNIHIIWLDGEKIGVVGLDVMPDHVWLKQLFILPEHQRKGVGSFIVTWAIEIARNVDKELKLQTLKSNSGAVKFYQKHGFELIEETDVHKKLSLRTGATMSS